MILFLQGMAQLNYADSSIIRIYIINSFIKTTAMSKEKSPVKEKNKKEPEKNLKEKRAEKKAKREGKR